MSSSGSSPPAPQAAATANNDDDTNDIPHETLPLLPSHPVGLCVQTRLFFASEHFVGPLRADVDDLLARFEAVWTSRHARVDDSDVAEANATSDGGPHEVFRAVWDELGWTHVHLLGTLDGPMRVPWGTSVLRAFIEHLRPDQVPLKQAGALFAVHAFLGTQATTMQKVHAQVDPATLDYILTLPDVLASALDSPSAGDSSAATNSSTPAIRPSLDLAIVLHSLLKSSSFFLIPTETFLHPPLPSVGVRVFQSAHVDELARAALGAEKETAALSSGAIWSVGLEETAGPGDGGGGDEAARSVKRRRKEELPAVYRFEDEDFPDEEDGAAHAPGPSSATLPSTRPRRRKEWEDTAGWSADLTDLRTNYVKAKASGFPRLSADAAAAVATPSATRTEGLQDDVADEPNPARQVLARAQGITLQALESVEKLGIGGGSGGGVPAAGEGGKKAGEKDLLGLVVQAEAEEGDAGGDGFVGGGDAAVVAMAVPAGEQKDFALYRHHVDALRQS